MHFSIAVHFLFWPLAATGLIVVYTFFIHRLVCMYIPLCVFFTFFDDGPFLLTIAKFHKKDQEVQRKNFARTTNVKFEKGQKVLKLVNSRKKLLKII